METQSIISGRLYLSTEINLPLVDDACWKKKALIDFSIKLENNFFPCPFGRKAWVKKSILYLFCEKQHFNEYDDFLSGMKAFTCFVKTKKIKDRILSPLVTFFSGDFYQRSKQHDAGWSALNYIHRYDPLPWPKDIPLSPEDNKWSFCFNGVQLFINMSSYEHKILHSRNLGRHLTFVINPRENFDIVANLKSKGGRKIREKIRTKVSIYNCGIVSKELGFYLSAVCGMFFNV
jgi:FPC/CPF motif-containing protein YcgG